MRILSQDGMKDIPYEIALIDMCVPCTENGEYKIYAQGSFIGLDVDVNYIQIAEYSTEEKAKKAMEMLRNVYYESEQAYKDGVSYLTTHFQFPADDEIEV